MSIPNLPRLALLTVSDPQAAWDRIRALAIPLRERWLALIATVALSTLCAWLLNHILGGASQPGPPPGTDPASDILAAMRTQLDRRPITFAGVQLAWTVVLVGIVTYVGRLFDGRARYEDVLLATVWMKLILLGVQVVQLLVVPFSVGVAALLAMAETILYLLLAVRLVQVVHGFRSPARVGLVMVIAFFVIIFALTLRLVLFGPTPPEL